VPIFAIIYAGIRSLINQMLLKKKMPVKTNDYMDVGSIEDGVFIPYEPEKGTFSKSGQNTDEAQTEKNEPKDEVEKED